MWFFRPKAAPDRVWVCETCFALKVWFWSGITFQMDFWCRLSDSTPNFTLESGVWRYQSHMYEKPNFSRDFSYSPRKGSKFGCARHHFRLKVRFSGSKHAPNSLLVRGIGFCAEIRLRNTTMFGVAHKSAKIHFSGFHRWFCRFFATLLVKKKIWHRIVRENDCSSLGYSSWGTWDLFLETFWPTTQKIVFFQFSHIKKIDS